MSTPMTAGDAVLYSIFAFIAASPVHRASPQRLAQLGEAAGPSHFQSSAIGSPAGSVWWGTGIRVSQNAIVKHRFVRHIRNGCVAQYSLPEQVSAARACATESGRSEGGANGRAGRSRGH